MRRLLNIRLAYDTPIDPAERAVQIAREVLDIPGVRELIHVPDSQRNADPPRVEPPPCRWHARVPEWHIAC